MDDASYWWTQFARTAPPSSSSYRQAPLDTISLISTGSNTYGEAFIANSTEWEHQEVSLEHQQWIFRLAHQK